MDIKIGDSIKVITGPFEGFIGNVSSFDDEKQTMRVMINMFGRDTQVELEYAQVDKL